VDILAPLSRSPIHTPLEVNLSALTEDRNWRGASCFKLRDVFRQMGLANQIYLSQSAFWLVHREAIDQVYELAFRFFHAAKAVGLPSVVDTALGYAMQILCANPEAHELSRHPNLWASDDLGRFTDSIPNGDPWPWRHPLHDQPATVRPAIVHMPSLGTT
jgi:hypothetical protein